MLTFFGHIHRSHNMEKLVVQGHAPSGRRRGRSPTRWMGTTKQLLDMSIKSATELTSIDRCAVVQSFVYLGSLIDNSGSCENEIRRHIQQARVAIAKLTKIWRDHNITKATKMSLVQSLVFSIFFYASETWTVKKADRVRIDAFETWTWRIMLRVLYTAHRTNMSILDELSNPKRLSSVVSTRMLTFFGHIHKSDNMEKLVVQGPEWAAPWPFPYTLGGYDETVARYEYQERH
ncbi:unnamed protein product [Callosobruchus maculatus]|uniref:Reverse transcriptase domain-containing protein n=1 Tax=Callosobruchus maculatus TaxID=64391 RepID=A0A653DW49_CALMS|nr:unnamed protein product [Callosobruchus maculatus]